MAHGCCVTHPSESGWFGEQMETAQTSCVTPGENNVKTLKKKKNNVKTLMTPIDMRKTIFFFSFFFFISPLHISHVSLDTPLNDKQPCKNKDLNMVNDELRSFNGSGK